MQPTLLRVKLDNRERGVYAGLHQQADPYDTNKIGGAQAVQFFKKFGLAVEDLKKIWLLSSSNGETLNREEFYVALRLISYAQNKIEVSRESVIREIPVPLPKFNSQVMDESPIDDGIFKIHPEQDQRYQIYVKQLDPTQSNFIQTMMAQQMCFKSQLPESKILQIINLVDANLSSKIKIHVTVYKVIVHLISLHRQGVAIPPQLPKCLQQYLNDNVPQQDTASFTASKIQNDYNFEPQVKSQSIPSKTSNDFNFEPQIKSQTKSSIQSPQFDLMEYSPTIVKSNNSLLNEFGFDNQPNEQKYSAFDILNSEPLEQQPKKKDTIIESKFNNDISMGWVEQKPIIEQKQNEQKPYQTRHTELIAQQDSSSQINKLISETQNKTQGQQILQLQTDFAQQLEVKDHQLLQGRKSLEKNIQEFGDFFLEIKKQNELLMREKEFEVSEINALNGQLINILQISYDENEYIQQQMRDLEEKRKDSISNLNRSIIDINNQLGINVKIRQTKKCSVQIEDITTYAQSLIQDIGKNVSLENQQKQRRDEQIQKELKDQRTLLSSMERQMKKLINQINELQNKSSMPVLITTNLNEFPQNSPSPYLSQHSKSQIELPSVGVKIQDIFSFDDHDGIPNQMDRIQQSVFENKTQQIQIQEIQLPINNNLPLSDDFNTPFDTQQQQILDHNILNAEIKSAPLFEIDVPQPELMQEIQFITNPVKLFDDFSEIKSAPLVVNFNFGMQQYNNEHQQNLREIPIKDALDFSEVESSTLDYFGDQQLKISKSLQEVDVQIELDLNSQFGATEWNEFDTNFDAFSQQVSKTSEFENFKW